MKGKFEAWNLIFFLFYFTTPSSEENIILIDLVVFSNCVAQPEEGHDNYPECHIPLSV